MDTSIIDCSLLAPFNMIVSGPTMSGKSVLTKEIIARRDEIIFPNVQHVIYCYGIEQPHVFKAMKNEFPEIQFQKGLPTEYGDDLLSPHLYILDDLMEEASKSKDVLQAFVRGSHHRNCSIVFITQNFFHDGLRPLTINARYIVLFKNPRETQVVNRIGCQMNCGKKYQLLEEAYKNCISKPHGYVFIDCSQTQNENYRIRSNLFPDENCIIFTKLL